MTIMGPAPARGAAARGLSPQRAHVLEWLQGRDGPVRASEAAVALGLHQNTARGHLDALAAAGLAHAAPGPADGRGRPAVRYRSDPDLREPDRRVRDYAALAEALTAHIAANSDDPAADARRAGTSWGRSLALQGGRRAGGPAQARRAVIEVLAELGFEPDADRRSTTAALRRCPILDAARRHPEVVCSVHLGVVRGVLEVLGGRPEQADMIPFAEPGACRLLLTAGPA